MTTTHLFDPDLSRRRNMMKLIPVLKQWGVWKEERIATLDAILLEATDIWEGCQFLAKRGVYCYDT